MPITPTNRTKNAITPSHRNKAGIATWGDSNATWGDALYGWGYDGESMSNREKNTITPVNRAKN